jgi:hypothetical protein
MVLLAVIDQFLDLDPGQLFFYGQVLIEGRDVMVGGGYDALGAEERESSVLEAFEGLGAGNLVDEMFVDIQYGGAAVNGLDDVPVPDLFK